MADTASAKPLAKAYRLLERLRDDLRFEAYRNEDDDLVIHGNVDVKAQLDNIMRMLKECCDD